MNHARVIFPCLRWRDRTADELWPEVRRAIDVGVGGFVVFGGSLSRMQELVRRSATYAGRQLLFAADVERGVGQQLEGATALPPPAALGRLGTAEVMQAAEITAREAAAAGIGWVLAPVADLDIEAANPIVGTRSFGGDPVQVSAHLGSWVAALQARGVYGCAKHFPGHGRTTQDSHVELPRVTASRAELEADLAPFKAAVAAGVRSVMLAHVSYPALDDSDRPASLSEEIVRLLRDELGFAGLLATDALIMDALSAGGWTEEAAACEAIRVGCDAILCPTSAEETAVALAGELASGRLDAARMQEAIDRVEQAAANVQVSLGATAAHVDGQRALELAAASLVALRGNWPGWRAGELIHCCVVDDDDVGRPAALPPGIEAPKARRIELADALLARGARLAGPGTAGGRELIAVFSDVRGWKGRAGLGEQTRAQVRRLLETAPEATVVLFTHPRLAAALPEARNIICGWSGEPLMQEAAARRLLDANH